MASRVTTFGRGFKPGKDDLLLLAFYSARKPCFEAADLPPGLAVPKAPGEKGASETAFIGLIGKRRVVVRSVRLDGETDRPALRMMKAVAAALAEARTHHCGRVVVPLSGQGIEDFGAAVQEGADLGGYAFDKYLKKKAKPIPVRVVSPAPSPALGAALRQSREVCKCVNFARDMANEPPNSCRPDFLAGAFRKQGKQAGLAVTVWNADRLRKEKCEGTLTVGRGSSTPPRMVIGKYGSPKAGTHLCLVGKGVTFDSGGYCLKNAGQQKGMKYDMGGAASMWAAACAIARLRLPIRLTVFAPIAENRVSNDAYVIDDVLRFRNGLTVEIMNTDAEGRLLLADALILAGESKPDYIVDAATLTGACVTALGQDIAGAIGTDAGLIRKLIAAGKAVDERFCELPMYTPYENVLNSTIADCKNGGGAHAGSIIGALFLKRFAPESIPWVHLDIAGPGNKEDPLDHLGKGAKGFGVKTMVQLALELA